MRPPCLGCKLDGRCDQQNAVAREVWLAWLRGVALGCGDREENYWHGIEGVAA